MAQGIWGANSLADFREGFDICKDNNIYIYSIYTTIYMIYISRIYIKYYICTDIQEIYEFIYCNCRCVCVCMCIYTYIYKYRYIDIYSMCMCSRVYIYILYIYDLFHRQFCLG